MVRDKRAKDNWALLAAQKIALEHNIPLMVCFQYIGKYKDANLRQFTFLFKGLEETSDRLNALNISFHLLQGRAENVLPNFINQHSIGSMVVDYSPIKVYKNRLGRVMNRISIPVHQVDAHNIIPLWMVSERKEIVAHTIRTKINSLLENFLTTIPPVSGTPD